MNSETRPDDDLANKSDWLEQVIIAMLLDLKEADGTTVHTFTRLATARPGSKQGELFARIRESARL
jgi:hypothetical protein